jgi:hypothetical protein
VTIRAAVVALLVSGGALRAQTPIVRFEDAGRGRGPAILRGALAAPHELIVRLDTAQVVLRRDTTYSRSVIVLAREVVVDGAVQGDVIVVGGDLHIHPRAVISGRAIAIGGGVYESTMSRVGAGTEAFRDFTYEVLPVEGGYALRYRSFVDRPASAVTLPALYGLRIPMYDRSDGVTLTVGPVIAVPNTDFIVEPHLSYRSQLGQFDPALGVAYAVSSRTTVRVVAERNTFSNEDWIWPDLLNSAATLFSGHDTRNHYRSKRVEAAIARSFDVEAVDLQAYVGARTERDESVRPDSNATGGPWSLYGRRDRDDMLRPNPRIDDGTISSGVAGARARWAGADVVALATLDLEAGVSNPPYSQSNGFVQATFDGSVQFPTFKTQTLRIDGHFVVSGGVEISGDRISTAAGAPDSRTRVPRQRWAYVGGPGSVPTLAMLERGGDQLVYIDGRYNIPIERLQLPLVGPPTVTLREVLAGADVGKFPSIAQSMGVRLAVSFIYVDFMFDPDTRSSKGGVGLSFAR